MRAFETLQSARELLKMSGLNDADREAELIVSHCLGIDRLHLYKEDPDIPEKILLQIYEYLRRRAAREPLQYILGYTEFHGLKIKVGPGVLIPRPETELLVEEAVKIIRSKQSNPPLPPFSKVGDGGITDSEINLKSILKILDLCTGSGCIALALAIEFPDAKVYGTDTSEVAIRYAEENARINDINNVEFLRGSLFEPFGKLTAPGQSSFKAGLIISNPPYIKRDEIGNLQPEITDWEPGEALDGGEDGLNYYKMLIPEARNYLKENGYLVLEIGIGQSDEVKWMAEEAGFQDIIVIRDYSGIERILIANKG
ncbi:MAG: peptide chain release factor N(5)-glutamine methyltransferase [Thermodesulfovibrionales bacterium]